jgi:hypothetical protein
MRTWIEVAVSFMSSFEEVVAPRVRSSSVESAGVLGSVAVGVTAVAVEAHSKARDQCETLEPSRAASRSALAIARSKATFDRSNARTLKACGSA